MSASHNPYGVVLPTGPKMERELSEALQRLVRTGLAENARHITEWLTNDAFLRGIRGASYNFLPGGNVGVTYEDESGELEFRLEFALEQYTIEKGRLSSVDVAPLCTPKGFGINAIRSSSMGQAVLDHLISEQMVKSALGHVLPSILKAGTVGIHGYVSKHGGRTYGHLEVIHPRELLSIPARVESGGEVIGIIRRRSVPFEWVQQQSLFKESLKNVSESDKTGKLGGTYQSWGYVPDSTIYHTRYEEAFLAPDAEINTWSRDDSSASSRKETKSKGTFYIRLNEFYLLGPDRTVARYIAHAGETVIRDIDYSDSKVRVPMPIGFIRYNDVGEMYGRSFLYSLVTLNRELEETYKIMMDQLQDDNALGLTLMPTTMGISDRDMKQTTKPRVIFYEPMWDLGTSHIPPFHIKPTNLTMFPINIAQVITEMMNLQSGQSAIYHGGAPGRVDSAASIAALTEAGNTGLRGPLESISDGFAQAYASILYQAKEQLPSGEAISMRSLDPRVLGIVSDPRTGELELDDKQSVPDWEAVNIGIASKEPKSRPQRMAELTEALTITQTISQTDFRIIARRENLDLPLASDGEWETYRKTMLNIRLLFGDGETPGKALLNPAVDVISVATEYLGAFMKGPEFALATKEVKNAFWEALQIYQNAKGGFPDQLPRPDLLAELAEQQQPQLQGAPE